MMERDCHISAFPALVEIQSENILQRLFSSELCFLSCMTELSQGVALSGFGPAAWSEQSVMDFVVS